jgi:hypothetical protein
MFRLAVRLLPIFALGLFFLAACAPAAGGPLSPPPNPTSTLAATPSPVLAQTITPPAAAVPAILETRRLTVEWPPVVRAGDADVIRLTLEVNEQGGITPTAEYAGHAVSGETVAIPDVFATHAVLAEARLDMAGLEISPAGLMSEALLPGRSVTFYWSVRPAEVGHYRGTVWLFLRFIPLAGGAESRSALAAMPIEIEAISFFGLRAGPARWLGAAGAFVGGVLGFPFFEDLARLIFSRRRRKTRLKKDDKNNM